MKIRLTLIAASLLVATSTIAQTPPKPAGAASGTPHPAHGCRAEIRRENATYESTLKKGIADGLIDAKEKAALEKNHAELLAMEKKAASDGKITLDECKAIHEKIVAERKKLTESIAVMEKTRRARRA